MPQTLQQQLVDVQAAIARAQTLQGYQAGGEGFQRANLRTLYERERDLLTRIRRETRGGASSVLDLGVVNG